MNAVKELFEGIVLIAVAIIVALYRLIVLVLLTMLVVSPLILIGYAIKQIAN